MSQVKEKPSYLVTDELTHAHNEFISYNLDLICLWAKIFRGYCGIGAVIIQLDENCRIIDIPTFSHEENIEDCDVFVAVTNDDEANVMSCMLAKEMGAHKVIALINNEAYVDLVQGKSIDVAIAPSQITIGTFLSELAGDEVVKVYSLRRGAAEAIETIVRPSPNGNGDVVGKELGTIKLPLGATIGAIIRKNKAKIAHDNVKIRENDHVILFLTDKKLLPQIKDIFSPNQ